MSQQGSHLEIERRWLLHNLPPPGKNTSPMTFLLLTSIYLLIEPEIEVRLRRVSYLNDFKADTFYLETKLGSGLTRQETPKLEVDQRLFDYYFQMTHLPHITKNHWELSLPTGLRLELSLFVKLGLVLAEIEFKSEEDARKFSENDFPDWLKPIIVKEVTEDSRYNGKNLALHGRPDPA